MSNKTVLFNDGEGIVYSDFNNAQRYITSQIWDTWGALMRTSPEAQGPNQGIALCYGTGGAPYASATTRTITHASGWIAQAGTGITGDDANLLTYYLADGEFFFQLGVGHASLPRYDAVFYKLDQLETDSESRDFKDGTTGALTTTSMNKQRAIRCQMQVVAGTPASIPLEPSVPTGYVMLCSIYVPATWNAVIDPLNILDYRTPAGITTVDCWGYQMVKDGFWGGTSYTTTNGVTPLVQSPSGGACDIYFTPKAPPHSRLIKVAAFGGGADYADLTCTLTGPSYTQTISTSSLFGTVPTTYREFALGFITTGISAGPVWSDGHAANYAVQKGLSFVPQLQRLQLHLAKATSTSGVSLYKVRFTFAGGL